MKEYSILNLSLIILSLPAIALCLCLRGETSYALVVDQQCSRIETVFARGSGSQLGDGEANEFQSQLNSRLKDSLKPHHYELGADSYNNQKYPAIDTSNIFNGNALGAFVSGGASNDYGKSVKQGVGELSTYLTKRYNKCRSADSYYVLGGYSQGAQVIGQTLPLLSTDIRSHILFVGLFGDPKLYYPEGDYFLDAPACKGKRSAYRRGPIVNCRQYQGSLGMRKPYLPGDMMTKTGLWCYAHDFVCGTASAPWDLEGHTTYKNPGSAIDQATQEAAAKILSKLREDVQPPSPSPSPTPTPKPDYDNLIDITHHYGEGLTGQNTVFLIDISDANKPNFPQILSYLDKTTHAMETKGQRFAIGIYGGAPYGPNSITATGIYPFGYGDADYQMSQLRLFIDLRSGGGGWPYFRGSVFDGITQTLPHYGWQGGANKSLIIFTNAPTLNGTVTTQASLALVIKASLAIDPVSIYPVTPQDVEPLYQDLADLTSGQTFSYDATNQNGIEQAGDTALEAIENKPVALLNSTEYIASPGQEVTFDASDSYALSGEIVAYDWDFDGDGTFEVTTSAPTVSHTYTNQFDGYIQVRVTDSHNNYGNASAPVKIGAYTAPPQQEAPTNLTATVIDSGDSGDTVQLNWNLADEHPVKQVLRVNGIMLGSMTPDRTSINVTDVKRTEDVIFSIASMNSSSEIGEEATVILTKLRTPFNTITPAATSNISTSHTVLASVKEASIFGMPSTNPITFGNINTASPIDAYSYSNGPQHTSDIGQSLKFIIPGLLFIAVGAAWGVIRFSRRS